jgi:hypothetical protein
MVNWTDTVDVFENVEGIKGNRAKGYKQLNDYL